MVSLVLERELKNEPVSLVAEEVPKWIKHCRFYKWIEAVFVLVFMTFLFFLCNLCLGFW